MSSKILNEYQTPEIYDCEYGLFKNDFKIFINKKLQGNILDLACGTGRLTLEHAKGIASYVEGIDNSKVMLERARVNSQGSEIEYRLGDIRNFECEYKFDCITLAGNSFQALITNDDQIKMLTCVGRHLMNDGVFIFNTRNPNADELQTKNDFEFWHNFNDTSGNIVKVYGKQIYDSSINTVLYTTKRVFTNAETLTKILLRFTALDELLKTLKFCDFEILNIYGDLDESIFCDTSPSIIVRCKIKS